MNKATRLLGTVAAAGMLALSASDPAAAQERLRWQVPQGVSSTLHVVGETFPFVADMLREMSGGNIDLRVAEPGTVIPALGMFDAVSDGTVEAGHTWMGWERGAVPAAALASRPFGLEGAEFLAWMYFHGGQELFEELFHPFDVHPIMCGTMPPETAGWFRHEVPTVEELRGIRMRSAGIGGEVKAEFGMSVTLIPAGEIFMSLETGVIDATEFTIPSVDEQLGFWQVAPYAYLPGWHQPATHMWLYVNLDTWNGLEPGTRAMFNAACMAATSWSLGRAEALQGEVLQRLEERGVSLRTFTDEQLAAFHEANQRVLDRLRAEDEMFDRILSSQEDFERLTRPWRELGYLPRDWMTRVGVE